MKIVTTLGGNSDPAAPLTPAQHRLLTHFNSMNAEAQCYLMDFAEAIRKRAPAPAPERTFRVIQGGAS